MSVDGDPPPIGQMDEVDLILPEKYAISDGLTRYQAMDAGKLYTKEIVDYEKSCRPIQSLIEDLAQIKPGDHIHWKRVGSWRDAIVTSVPGLEETSRMITVIRYGYVFPQMVIREEKWELSLTRDTVYRFEYGEYCHPPSVVVTRAKACIEQKGYNAMRNNNDDFCRWCKSGKHTYLCVNETVLSPNMDTKHEEGTYRIIITSIDEMNQGDHIAWSQISFDCPEKDGDDGWRHGIVVDNDEEKVDIMGFEDKSLSISKIEFDQDKIVDFKMRRIVYEKCHMLDEVLDRAKYRQDAVYTPEECKYFSHWCKTGMPQDAEAVDTVLIQPKSETQEDEELKKDADMKKEVGNSVARSSATSAARGGVEGVALVAAKQVPRTLVRGAAEGAAAVAAVGVEAVVLAVDVGLTYRNFKRCEISKDDLQRQHIQNTVRSVGAAGASVGGGVAGAAIGTLIFPGVGTLVGGIVGGVVGGISGQVGGHFAGKGIAYAARRPYDKMFVENLVLME